MNGADPGRWSAVADLWSAAWGSHPRRLWQIVRHMVAAGPGTRVLDVGCGTGELLEYFADADAITVGVDPAPQMAASAARRVPAATIRVAGADDLPWPDASFDLVTAVNVLELAGDDCATELVRVAAPGGHVAVANWAEDAINATELLERAAGGTVAAATPRRERGALSRLLGHCGVDVIVEDLVDMWWCPADDDALLRGLIGVDLRCDADDRVLAAARPFRGRDGGYHVPAPMRYAIGRRR